MIGTMNCRSLTEEPAIRRVRDRSRNVIIARPVVPAVDRNDWLDRVDQTGASAPGPSAMPD
ncbi:hypothetical protein GCM10027059_27880 [Myceligenerans halotolerans]